MTELNQADPVEGQLSPETRLLPAAADLDDAGKDMAAEIWAAGASREDAEFITKMLVRKGLHLDRNDWKLHCLTAIKQLHEALDVIEAIDSECLLPGQLKDMVDAVLAPRREGEAAPSPAD